MSIYQEALQLKHVNRTDQMLSPHLAIFITWRTTALHHGMANLDSLPVELVFKIASFLCPGRELGAFARINPNIYKTILPLIYNHINIELQRINGTWNPKMELLLRSLRARPALAKYIIHVDLRTFTTCHTSDEESKNTNLQVRELLRPLSNLRSLGLEAAGPGHFRYNLTDSVDHTLDTLEYVRLNNPVMKYEDVCVFLQQPNIQNFQVATMDYCTLSPDLLDSTLFGTTSLSRLESTVIHISQDILVEILRLPKCVRHLVIKTPGSQNPSYGFSGLDFAGRVNMATPLSPSRIGVSIQAVRNTLISLRILEDSCTSWPGHDGTRLDLTSFTALQTLSVPSHLLFPGKSPNHPSRNGLYKLLGPSIREIHITFDYDHYLLYNGDEDWKAFHNRGEDVDEARYEWMVELAEHKANATSDLIWIKIREQWNRGCKTPQVLCPWRMPSRCRELFESRGIDVDVWMRRPRDWKAMVRLVD